MEPARDSRHACDRNSDREAQHELATNGHVYTNRPESRVP
jgi:hypothetical protein